MLRRTFSPPFDAEDWFSLTQSLPERDRLAFIPLALSTSLALPGDGRAFLWSIEALWLSLAPAQRERIALGASQTGPIPIAPGSTPTSSACRPTSTSLPACSRLPGRSRLCLSGSTRPAEAILRGSRLAIANRLDSWERLERTLQGGVPHSMLQIPSSEVPETDRGRWLSHILEGLGTADRPGYLDDLEACGQAWSQAFESGSPSPGDRRGASGEGARAASRPARALGRNSGKHGITPPCSGTRKTPERSVGLAAHVLARTSRDRHPQGLWNLRRPDPEVGRLANSPARPEGGHRVPAGGPRRLGGGNLGHAGHRRRARPAMLDFTR